MVTWPWTKTIWLHIFVPRIYQNTSKTTVILAYSVEVTSQECGSDFIGPTCIILPRCHRFIAQFASSRWTKNILVGLHSHIQLITKLSKNRQNSRTRCQVTGPIIHNYTVSQKTSRLWLANYYDNFWHRCYRESRQSKCTLFSHLT